MRVAALVEPNRPGVKLITALAREDIPISAVVVEVGPPKKPRQKESDPIRRAAAKAQRLLAGLQLKIFDHYCEAIYWGSQLVGLRPPSWLPPWTINRQHFSPDYYRRFTNRFMVTSNFNSQATVDFLKQAEPDIIVLCGVYRIIKKQVLDIPRLGTLNAHPGALPKYRGVDPLPHALLNREQPVLTVALVDQGIDTGPVLETEPIPIGKNDDIEDLWKKSEDIGARLMVKAVRSLMDGTASPRPQDNSVPYYNRRMSRAEKREAARRLKEMQKGMR